MISYLPDKFAGKAYKFVEIDHQVLENKGLKKPFHVMKPLLDQKTSKLPVYTWLRDIQGISPSLSL